MFQPTWSTCRCVRTTASTPSRDQPASEIFAQEDLSGKEPAEKLIRYSLSPPVSAVVIGMPKVEFIDENIATVNRFEPLPPAEMKKLSSELSMQHKARLDRFFCDHIDC